MSTLSIAMDVLIFCLCLPLFLLPPPSNEGSLVWACTSPCTWGATGGRSCQTSPRHTRGREDIGGVPRGTRRWGLHGGTRADVGWSSPGTPVSPTCPQVRAQATAASAPPWCECMDRLMGAGWGCKCTSLHVCAGIVLSGMFMTGPLLTSLFLSRS